MTFIIKKIGYSILTLFFISIIVFSLFEIMPQSPILSKISIERASDTQVLDALSKEYDLDKPPIYRYKKWLKTTLSSESQYSILYPTSTVSSLIGDTFPTTLKLTFYSLFLSLLMAIPVTIYIALNRKAFLTRFFKNGSIIFLTIPSFLLSLIFIYIFCIKLHFFSITGGSLVLPVFVLSLPATSLIIRYLLPRMKKEVKEDYITLLKSKGLTNKEIILTHVLKNSLIPVISICSIIFTSILTGTVIVENVFALNGTGRLMVNAINGGDYILIEALVLTYCTVILIFSVIVDILYYMVDKRIKIKWIY